MLDGNFGSRDRAWLVSTVIWIKNNGSGKNSEPLYQIIKLLNY